MLIRISGIPASPEAPILEASTVAGMGYAESKWVGERILQTAAARTPLRSRGRSSSRARPAKLREPLGGARRAWPARPSAVARAPAACFAAPRAPTGRAPRRSVP